MWNCCHVCHFSFWHVFHVRSYPHCGYQFVRSSPGHGAGSQQFCGNQILCIQEIRQTESIPAVMFRHYGAFSVSSFLDMYQYRRIGTGWVDLARSITVTPYGIEPSLLYHIPLRQPFHLILIQPFVSKTNPTQQLNPALPLQITSIRCSLCWFVEKLSLIGSNMLSSANSISSMPMYTTISLKFFDVTYSTITKTKSFLIKRMPSPNGSDWRKFLWDVSL